MEEGYTSHPALLRRSKQKTLKGRARFDVRFVQNARRMHEVQIRLTYWLAYSLTYSLNHSLNYLFMYLLIYLLTYLITYLLTYLLTYSIEQSPSWETNLFSASQEIPRILWNSNFITAITSARHLSLSHSLGPRLSVWTFRNMICFYCEELLAPRSTPKLEDHPFLAIRECLFNIFAATFHIGGRSSSSKLRMCHAVVTGTHLSQGTLKRTIRTSIRCAWENKHPY